MSSRAKTTSAAPPSSAADSPLRIRQGFAVGRDQTPIWYRVSGPAGAPAVVFCDGIGCDGYVWKYLESVLSAGHQVGHGHYRGHGRTPAPRDPRCVDIVDLADDLAGVMSAALGDGVRAVLAGHSMGVQVCLETYRRHPERVRGLLLLCGSYGTPLRTFKGKRTLEQVLPWVRFPVNRIPGMVGGFLKRVLATEL